MSTAAVATPTEHELIRTAQFAISHCNWTVGECAVQWTKRYAKGRTDADFGNSIGLSGDQVYQRRRVWETFADVKDQYENLKWSHFYVALTWQDAPECLAWGNENQATVAEMKAWRRLQRGEDLTVDAEAELDLAVTSPGYGEAVVYRTEEKFGEADGARTTSDSFLESQTSANRVDVVTPAGPEGTEAADGYAPFRKGAATVPPKSEGEDYGPVTLSVEDTVKRMTVAIERCNRLLTNEFIANFGTVSEKAAERFRTAVENLNEKLAELD